MVVETKQEYDSLPAELREKLDKAYHDALGCQDACNLSGVLYSFSRHMDTLCDVSNKLGKGTDFRNEHPITIYFSSKLASLSRSDSFHEFHEASKIMHERFGDDN